MKEATQVRLGLEAAQKRIKELEAELTRLLAPLKNRPDVQAEKKTSGKDAKKLSQKGK